MVKYHGLARRYLTVRGFLMRPLLNGGTLGGPTMGADAFAAFYGIRLMIDGDEDEDLEPYEDESHEDIRRAHDEGLDTYFGRLTDGEPYFLLVGKRLAVLGVENEPDCVISDGEFARITAEVRRKLAAAGLKETPALHLQLDAQY